MYEEQILATGGLDERIFTGEGANEEIGTPGPCLCERSEKQGSGVGRLHASLAVRRRRRHPQPLLLPRFSLTQVAACCRQASALRVSTPLTGRRYVQENLLASPVSTAMNSVGRLHTLLSGAQQGPSAKLAETLRWALRAGAHLCLCTLKVCLQDLLVVTQSVRQGSQ